MKIVQNNKNEVLRMLDQATDSALWAIGAEMEANAKNYETRVHTGRLRNSITFATHRNQGETYSYTDNDGNVYTDQIGLGARKDRVYVGTNVEYAPVHELGYRKISALHFLQRSVSDHADRYKAILEAALRD